MTRAQEASATREFAVRFFRTDPRFAADLCAAADRHERGENASGGAGLLAIFDPKERHEVQAVEDSRLLLVLSPWPGDGHPSE